MIRSPDPQRPRPPAALAAPPRPRPAAPGGARAPRRPGPSALGPLGALALGLVTCAGPKAPLAPPPAPAAPDHQPPPALAPAPPPAPAPDAAAEGPARGAPQPVELPGFFGRLCELRAGARHDHVRVAWLGDSHAAADIWTGVVRRRLQERYGNGGPGFVHIGWKAKAPLRHEGVAFSASARWRLEPPDYSRNKRFDDGVLGLGGVRTLPTEAGARARVEVTDPALRGEPLRWTLSYRHFATPASALVALGDGTQHKLRPEGPARAAPQQRSFRGPDAFEIRGGRGLQFFGLVAEAEAPGLVVDTLGLNGARLSTLLAWDEASWVGELARRKPDLVALAYGTNESQEPPGNPGRFGEQLDAVLDRVRKAAPEADCLVILPMERGERAAQERLAAVSDALAARARARRCALWDARAAMGGPGSFAAWQRETPPLAAPDGVHLKTRGYLALGEALARDLLEGAGRCEPQRPSSPVERPVP
ncbi:MAG TPA: GDSL-type esterase/lipase family protein [Polyangiaceae bacterium]|nr:GDSL-type esterase/lipase family protein [Polyangiaceae bacterium]